MVRLLSILIIVLVLIVIILVALVTLVVASILLVWVVCICVVVPTKIMLAAIEESGGSGVLTIHRSSHLLRDGLAVAGHNRNVHVRNPGLDALLGSRHHFPGTVAGRSLRRSRPAEGGPT